MKGMKTTLGVLLGIASAWLVLNGVSVILQTMGRVTGGLFGLWSLIPSTTIDESTFADGTEQ